MPLTPEDVRNKLFTTVRLREGYEQAEVDEFLDEVEAELIRLLKENDDLRQKLIEAGSSGAPAVAAAKPAARPEPEPKPEPKPEPVAVAPAPAPPPPQQIIVRTAEDVGDAAAKVLSMAQRTADQVIDEARTEAEQTRTEAKDEAERLTSDARSKADKIDRETRERTAALEQQLEQQRQAALGKLEAERARLANEVEGLKAFEREYRGRLRSFLEGQLTQLTSRGSDDTPLAPAGSPGGTSEGGESGPMGASRAYAGSHGGEADDTGPAGIGSPGASSPYGTAGSSGNRSALGRILDEEERKSEDHSNL